MFHPTLAHGEGCLTVAHRILLVEDEPALVMTLCDRLRAEGHTVD